MSVAVTAHPRTPVTARAVAPLGIAPSDVPAALALGHRLVDIRPQAARDRDGVLPGALALDPDLAVARLVPGTPDSLRIASGAAGWIVVGTDGHDAEWLTWHLHARGVAGARFLLGGMTGGRLVRLPPTDRQRRDLATFAAH